MPAKPTVKPEVKPKPKVQQRTVKKPPARAAAKPTVKPTAAPAAGAGTHIPLWVWIMLILIIVGVVVTVVVALVLMSDGSGSGGGGGNGGSGGAGTWRDLGCPYQGTYGTCSYDLWCDPGETYTNCPSDCNIGGAGMEGALGDCLQEPTDVDWNTCVALVAYDYDEINLCECILDSYLEDFCKDVISGDFDWDDYSF